ncbi:MAG: Pup--protein ligase [Corynebacterium sp.]|nr:Pup--protein ligase [Corynebacterium sp.]
MEPLFHRIFGVETEYGVTCTVDGQPAKDPEEVARTLFHPIMKKYGATNVFMPNGGRLYLDVGSHPEFATPECDDALQLLAYDRAGDEIMRNLAAEASEELGGRVYIFKNNVDSAGNSYGCHENYLVDRDMVLKHLGVYFLPFLVTRQLFTGAGKIYVPYPGSASAHFGAGYCLSQRADHVWDGVSSATTRSRPMINTRDEPHADSHLYRRLHIISGDSNISQSTMLAKIVSTQLVLEMVEAQFMLEEFPLKDPLEAIRMISRDPTGRVLLPLEGGGEIPALVIAFAYLDKAKRWYAQRPFSTKAMDLGLDIWERALVAIDQDEPERLKSEIDWVIKKDILDRYDLPITDMKMRQVDLAYHDLNGLGRMMEKKGYIRTLIDDATVAKAVDTPPETTRAHIRGQILAEADKLGLNIFTDWMYNKYGTKRVEFPNPFATESSEAEAFIEYLRAEAHNAKD